MGLFYGQNFTKLNFIVNIKKLNKNLLILQLHSAIGNGECEGERASNAYICPVWCNRIVLTELHYEGVTMTSKHYINAVNKPKPTFWLRLLH